MGKTPVALGLSSVQFTCQCITVMQSRYVLYSTDRIAYCLCHPKGTDAPSGIHPSQLIKEGKVKVNHLQRIPHLAEAVLKDPARYEMLKAVLSDIFEFVCQNVGESITQINWH